MEKDTAVLPKIPPIIFTNAKKDSMFFLDYESKDRFTLIPIYTSRKGSLNDLIILENGDIYVLESTPDQILHFKYDSKTINFVHSYPITNPLKLSVHANEIAVLTLDSIVFFNRYLYPIFPKKYRTINQLMPRTINDFSYDRDGSLLILTFDRLLSFSKSGRLEETLPLDKTYQTIIITYYNDRLLLNTSNSQYSLYSSHNTHVESNVLFSATNMPIYGVASYLPFGQLVTLGLNTVTYFGSKLNVSDASLERLENGQQMISFILSMPAQVSIELTADDVRPYHLIRNTTLYTGYHSFSLSASLDKYTKLEIQAEAIYSLSNRVSKHWELK